jgi:hypothetical protein
MSRGRSDDRHEPVNTERAGRPAPDPRPPPVRYDPAARLRLPRTQAREVVEHRGRRYQLNGPDVRLLATVGAFRVVPASEVDAGRSGHDVWNGPIRQLADQGLLERKTVVVNHEPRAVVVLTREAKALLEAREDRESGRRQQQYHARLVKPREIAHDSQLYRLFQAAATPLEAEGNRIERVVLDYELKREYQTFLNRPGPSESDDQAADAEAFASRWSLPVTDGHIELPDLRIEYETPDGRLEHRDLELVTEHYSRGQLAGKARAGFALYRASGSGGGRSGVSRPAGTPFDPHHLEWLR